MPHGNDISAIAVSDLNPAQILIGTGSGVFLSEDSGEGWMNISGALKDKEVRSVAINHAGFYAGGESGLFFTNDKGGHWDRILVKGTTKETGAEEDPETQPEDLSPDEGVAFIAMNDSNIYAAVGKVIYYSGMGKNEWSTLPDSGLKGYVNFILPSKTTSKVYAGTTRGAYEYLEESGRWEGLTAGIPNANVNRLSFESSEEKTLWAATDKGLFKLETTRLVVERRSEVEGQIKDVFVMMDNEPAFQELAQAAIRYADVSPDKIKKWHMESRFKALMPKLSIGSGKNKSNTSEIYTSATKDYIVVGPDRISDSFDVSLSWELGNLIWSDDQTNIDVRSRLMVQLRNDILDDLRRAFYERKRLRLELAVNPPPDIRAKFEKELRLQELGSTIDDLTGNYLSSKIQDLRREGGAY